MREKIVFINIVLLFGTSLCENKSESEITENIYLTKSEHSMASYWRLLSLLSPIGVGFNGFVLYLLVIERKNLIKSVNFMMW